MVLFVIIEMKLMKIQEDVRILYFITAKELLSIIIMKLTINLHYLKNERPNE
jgi:hypothetical protein